MWEQFKKHSFEYSIEIILLIIVAKIFGMIGLIIYIFISIVIKIDALAEWYGELKKWEVERDEIIWEGSKK